MQKRDISIPVILMTSHGTTDTAIQATNLGAFDYVIKPLEIDELLGELAPLIRMAMEISRPSKKRVHLPGTVADDLCSTPLLGDSKPMQEVYKRIGRVARSDVPVIIRGETGTGKELVVKAIHDNGPRKEKPFVAINCTALNEALLDDELFGHEAGAYTGANKLRKGRFEYADGGTLFLDEVGDMPRVLQAKLLRVLEDQQVSRIGSNESIKVDVRVLSATHRDLEAFVREEKFREDLLFRLNGVTILLPPLRERGDDLQILVEFFLERSAKSIGRALPILTDESWRKLRACTWPGNVRQLQNVIRRATLISRGARITPDDLQLTSGQVSSGGRGDGSGGDVDESQAIIAIRQAVGWALGNGRGNLYSMLHDLLERELIEASLKELDGNQAQVAKRLGIARNTLRARIQQYGLEP